MTAETRLRCGKHFTLDGTSINRVQIPYWEGRFVWGMRVFADGCDSVGLRWEANCIVVIRLELRGADFWTFCVCPEIIVFRGVTGN